MSERASAGAGGGGGDHARTEHKLLTSSKGPLSRTRPMVDLRSLVCVWAYVCGRPCDEDTGVRTIRGVHHGTAIRNEVLCVARATVTAAASDTLEELQLVDPYVAPDVLNRRMHVE